jgi:Glycosyl transferases group 1
LLHLSDTSANPFRGSHPPTFPRLLRPAGLLAVDALLRFSGARRLVVPSAFSRDKLVRREGLPADRITVLPWPLPPAAERERPPRAARAPGVEGPFRGKPRAREGSAYPRGGLPCRLESPVRPHLTLVGDAGAERVRRLREAATGLPVAFRGQLEHEAVLREYAEHDVLVFPSVWDEPLALVPLEAAAMGLAVIATTSGGTPERSPTATPASWCRQARPRPSRALLALADDPPRARALGVAARAHVLERHAFAPFLERLEALYGECAKERRDLAPPYR